MFKSIVYIEKKIAKSKATKDVVDKINPESIILIEHYKDILNQPNSSWQFNKKYQKIVLAKRENEFYYEGSHLTQAMGYTHFYYNTLALNCLFHCEYCYLQGMYNTPHLVLFLNNQDFIAATQHLIKKLRKPVYMALSYDTDLLALEKFYPYCTEWIAFAHTTNNLQIEIRTKSHQTECLEKVLPSDNVLLSFTLSPESIQKIYEPFTPKLAQRLIAVKKLIRKGFRVMLCFDPLIYVPDFQNVYASFLDNVFSEISPNMLDAASVGVFRMNNEFLKRIRKNGNTSDIYFYSYSIQNKMATYPDALKKEMITFVKDQLIHYGVANIYIYE